MSCRKPIPFDTAFNLLDLTPVQKVVLKNRFMPLLSHLYNRTLRVSVMFHIGRVIVTVGSLIVPALLSIQMSESGKELTYWATWTISLFVTICNALLTLFKLDKRYYYLHTCVEQLHSEGWQYIELSGKYSGFNTPSISPTHSNQFVYFCHAIEKIRMRQVEEEYFKMVDTNQAAPANPNIGVDSLIPPTPLKDEFKRMVSQLHGEPPTPIIDKPIVSYGRGAYTDSKTGLSDETDSESVPYRGLQPMSIPRVLSPTIPEGVSVLRNS